MLMKRLICILMLIYIRQPQTYIRKQMYAKCKIFETNNRIRCVTEKGRTKDINYSFLRLSNTIQIKISLKYFSSKYFSSIMSIWSYYSSQFSYILFMIHERVIAIQADFN